MDERRAIELCVRHQDPVGFEFLVQKYRREAFMHAVALLGNHHDALDACQDSFAKALDRMIADAQRLGANAVVEARFATSVLMGGAAELLAYGTAVVVEDE